MPAIKNKIKAIKYPSDDMSNRKIIAARNILDNVSRLMKVVIIFIAFL